ncbi:MAG: exodeoxyribonuclease VII small subunit [Rhabdochlamydiaceae bacterium]|nr:exodeoxyribonuclease VII small subunit [Candidatus Amphrikana amoebophyrae]
MSDKSNTSFETAYERLEQILAKMNSSEIALEESLKLFEEADSLIRGCGEKLQGAKQKIEVLIKDRNGNVETSNSGQPQTAPFTHMGS